MEDVIYLILYLLTEILNYLLAYVIFFQASVNKRKRSWILGLGILFVVHFYALYVWGIYTTTSLSIFSMLVVPLFLLGKREKKYFFLYLVIVMGISTIATGVSFFLAIYVDMPEYLVVENPQMLLLCQCIPIGVMTLLYCYQRIRKQRLIQVQLRWQQYLLFYIGIICTYLLLASAQIMSQEGVTEKLLNMCGLGISIACIVFVILILWQGIVVYREFELRERIKINEKYVEWQTEHSQQILEQDEKMRRFRHDMNAHITILKSYCANGENQELENYLESIIKESAIYETKSYTGNKMVDVIIAQFENEAKTKGIVIEIKGTLPEKIEISAYDSCTIISNLMRNAIEACEKIEVTSDRIIKFKTGVFNEHIGIIVENRVAPEAKYKGSLLHSSKNDRKNHGLGMGNVENAVKKYCGTLEYKLENQWFMVEVLI